MIVTTDHKLEHILGNVGDLGFRRRIVTLLDYLQLKPDDLVLDAGCGEGFYEVLFRELYGCRVEAVDFDPRILSMAMRWVKDRHGPPFRRASLLELPYADGTFDKIVCSEVLEHVPDHEGAARELCRVLKPGGVLALTVPNHNYPLFWDPLNKMREALGLGHFSPDWGFFGGIWAMHLRLYYPHEICALLEGVGFQIDRVDALTHYCAPFNHNILYLGKQFYTRLPVPEAVRVSMEKFEWQKVERKKAALNPLQWALAVLKAVDSLNDRIDSCDTRLSSMCVAVRAVRPR